MVWCTTTACAYRPPNLTLGYTGYLPQQQYGYGDTFGNIAAEQFHKQRTVYMKKKPTVNTTPPPFPTTYSNDPALVLADRKRSYERRLATQKYNTSVEGTKEEQLRRFLLSCQFHRKYYKDTTGTIQRVEEFLLPRLKLKQQTQDSKQ